jgi:hypothetical protein
MTRIGLVSLVVLSFILVGCGSYYIVKDPTTGKAYYTTKIEKTKSGAVSLKDEKSGAEVTILNSEVREVEKSEYKKGLSAPAPAPPPAPAPAQPAK